MAKTAKKNDAAEKAINLALQGGGAHGSFTWGVLDRFLEDERITIDGISATSAGAMNAAVLCYGMATGGRAEARELLDKFWKKVSDIASFSPVQPSIFDKMMGNADMKFSPSFAAMDFMTRVFSPSQLNILDINPLRDILEEIIDFKILQKQKEIKLFANATSVRSGKVKVFECAEMTADTLIACSCLPFLSKTVEIDGEPYWDGGYSGNPAIFPLIYNCDVSDVVIVQIHPIKIEQTPVTAQDILDRVNEISFNSTLMREIRAITFVSKLISEGKLAAKEYKDMKLHMIESKDIMADLGHASKFNADWVFLVHLKEIGRQAADDWLKKNYSAVGEKSSIDPAEYFL